jgi:DNA (cytosine-5)-methyltransferase 1
VKTSNFSDREQIALPLHWVITRPRFTFIDLFAGIGGFRIALEKLGGRCVGYSEIDKQAIQIYRKNFIHYLNSDEIAFGDVTKIRELPRDVDVIVGGVPCQPWSVAGCLRGFDDPRGKLWFDVIRLVQESRPKSFIFENVRGLASPKNRDNLELIFKSLESANYVVDWKVLNAYDFGLPQNRERVFIVGMRQDIEREKRFEFPEPLNIHPKVLDILDSIPRIKPVEKTKLNAEVLFNGFIPPSRTRFQKEDELNNFFIFSDLRNGHTTIHSWDILETTERQKQICLALLKLRRSKKSGEKDGHPVSLQQLQTMIQDIRYQELDELVRIGICKVTSERNYEFMNSKNMSGIHGIYRVILPTADIIPTLTATGAKDYIAMVSIHAQHPQEYKKLFLEKIYRPRKYREITAKDARKLQGFPSDFIYHEKEEIAKKQFGNAVPVPVVEYVAKNVLEMIKIQ